MFDIGGSLLRDLLDSERDEQGFSAMVAPDSFAIPNGVLAVDLGSALRASEADDRCSVVVVGISDDFAEHALSTPTD